MCFGPAASFSAGAFLAAAGAATLKSVRSKKETLLAAFPLFFAAQQLIEGVLWLTVGDRSRENLQHALAFFYLVFAQVFWPVYSPLSVYLLEPDEKRRKIILPFLFFGIAVGLYLLYFILKGPIDVFTSHYSLRYWTSANKPFALILFYIGASFMPFLLSTYRPLALLGVLNIVLCAVAYVFYSWAFESVWCFYAAIVSACLFFFLRWGRV